MIKLKEIVAPFKRSKGYDCIIGVSGGKDSHFQVYFVKEVLGLKPLLVTFNHLDNSKTGIRNLENLIVKLGVDHIRFTPSPEVVRKSVRWAIKSMSDPFWHEHAGIYTFPVQIAEKYDVPLIIWGEYGFQDLIGGFEDFVNVDRTLVKKYGLRGRELGEFLEGNDEGLTERDMEFAIPTDYKVKGLYLGQYVKWDALKQTELMIKKFDFSTDQKERTFNSYENVECYFNDSVHDWFRYQKLGYGRATDHASQLIRMGQITREEGAWLVNKYEPIKHGRWFEFLKWVGMTEEEVMGYIERDRDPRAEFGLIEPAKEPLKLPYLSNYRPRLKGRMFI
jgi:N-acetyl sugar amidotransferase